MMDSKDLLGGGEDEDKATTHILETKGKLMGFGLEKEDAYTVASIFNKYDPNTQRQAGAFFSGSTLGGEVKAAFAKKKADKAARKMVIMKKEEDNSNDDDNGGGSFM